MTPTERRRLVGVLGLLASDQDGERAAAGLLATRLLRSAGATWEEVIPEKSGQLGHSIPTPSGWRTDLALTQRQVRFLRAWEQNFVSSLVTVRAPSQKQQAILREIAGSLRARGRA